MILQFFKYFTLVLQVRLLVVFTHADVFQHNEEVLQNIMGEIHSQFGHAFSICNRGFYIDYVFSIPTIQITDSEVLDDIHVANVACKNDDSLAVYDQFVQYFLFEKPFHNNLSSQIVYRFPYQRLFTMRANF